MKLFQKICRMKQLQLKKWLLKRYMDKGYAIRNEDGYLYLEPKENALPVCFTAHMDTVHKEAVRQIEIEKHPGKTIISSPQGIGGDDRCGIYMICRLLDKGLRPYVVFCEDEESGCIGARKFAKSGLAAEMGGNVKFIVELDRRNANDAVYYDLDNEMFEGFVTEITGYKTADGSYSDICEIVPKAKVAAVNLSCGYYKEHTLEHYVVWEEMLRTLAAAETLAEASVMAEKFEYKALPSYLDGFGYGYGAYTVATVTWIENGELKVDYQDGYSEAECLGYFLMDHPGLSYREISIDYEMY